MVNIISSFKDPRHKKHRSSIVQLYINLQARLKTKLYLATYQSDGMLCIIAEQLNDQHRYDCASLIAHTIIHTTHTIIQKWKTMTEEQQDRLFIGAVQLEQLTVKSLDYPRGQGVDQVLTQLDQCVLVILAFWTVFPRCKIIVIISKHKI